MNDRAGPPGWSGLDARWLARFSAWSRPAGYLILAALLFLAPPRPGLTGVNLAVTVLTVLVLATAYLDLFGNRGTEPEAFFGRPLRQARPPRIAVLAAHGMACALLVWLTPDGAAIALPFIAAGRMGRVLPARPGIALAATTAALTAAGLLVDGAALSALVVAVGVGFAMAGGQVRRLQLERAEQSELLLAQSERARSADARNHALAERARIAREIHDVLAHSLSAVSMQLELAEALLDERQYDRAASSIRRAGSLARQGMVETRQAVLALREDAPPLPQALRALAESAGASLRVAGQPRPLGTDATLTVYRAMQEALTNARKHAPGATTSALLAYQQDRVRLDVTDQGAGPSAPSSSTAPPSSSAAPSRTDSGAGAGLAGMRERVELIGGTLEAGPDRAGWRVRVTLPV